MKSFLISILLRQIAGRTDAKSEVVECRRAPSSTPPVAAAAEPAPHLCRVRTVLQLSLQPLASEEYSLSALPRPVEPPWPRRPSPAAAQAAAAPAAQAAAQAAASPALPLQTAVVVRVRKSAVAYLYTPAYVGQFRAEPEEVVERVSANSCRKGDPAVFGQGRCAQLFSTSAVRPADGGSGPGRSPPAAIEGSAGFCCPRGLGQMLKLNSEGRRQGDGSTVHCLRWKKADSGNRWSVHRLKSPQFNYSVELEVLLGDQAVATLTLTDQVPIQAFHWKAGADAAADAAADAEAGAGREIRGRVRIIGDFQLLRQLPTFADVYFVRPQSAGSAGRGASESAALSAGFLLDRQLFDLDGGLGACNKLGVSQAAFAAQGSRCELPRGSCLHGQLQAVARPADEVVQKTCGHPGLFVTQGTRFGCVVEAAHATELALTMEAADLAVLVGDVPARILNAYGLSASSSSRGGSPDGQQAVVEVESLSNHHTGSFQLHVACREPEAPAAAAAAAAAAGAAAGAAAAVAAVESPAALELAPRESRSLTFHFASSGAESLNLHRRLHCTATLTGLSEHTVLDAASFRLDLQRTHVDIPQLNRRLPTGYVFSPACYCRGSLRLGDVVHAVTNRCFERLAVWGAVCLGTLAILAFAVPVLPDIILWLFACLELLLLRPGGEDGKCGQCGKRTRKATHTQ